MSIPHNDCTKDGEAVHPLLQSKQISSLIQTTIVKGRETRRIKKFF